MQVGLTKVSMKEYVNNVGLAGANKDVVKLWLVSAKYFADLDYSLGSIFEVQSYLNDIDA